MLPERLLWQGLNSAMRRSETAGAPGVRGLAATPLVSGSTRSNTTRDSSQHEDLDKLPSIKTGRTARPKAEAVPTSLTFAGPPPSSPKRAEVFPFVNASFTQLDRPSITLALKTSSPASREEV